MSDVELEVRKLDVVAGDVVVVHLPQPIPHELIIDQIQRLQKTLPEGVRAIFIAEDVELSTLTCCTCGGLPSQL